MTDTLPPISPVSATCGTVLPTDVDATLRGLAPGVYLAADLYRRYLAWAKSQDREPGHAVAFGQVLKSAGARPTRRNGGRAWAIEVSLTKRGD